MVGAKTKQDVEDRLRQFADPAYWDWVYSTLKSFSWYEQYNWTPTTKGPVIFERDGQAEIASAAFGLTGHRGNAVFNARSETVDQLNIFSKGFRERRAIIPVIGWYEWIVPKGKGVPHMLHQGSVEDLPVFFMAGIWRHSESLDRSEFAVITAAADGGLQAVHDRMPVIMREDLIRDWLNTKTTDPAEARLILADAISTTPAGVSWHEVGREVGNSRSSGSQLILPV